MLARRYLRGEGVEIGALNEPLPLPRGARVRYVDRMPLDGLRRAYPELDGVPLVEPDVVDDGERLDAIAPESLDFIVANHFIEHTEDPIGTIASHLGRLRPGGVLFMAVPDMRFTFDAGREETTIEHLMRDHREGPEASREEHRRSGHTIHFHCWTRESFAELLSRLRGTLDLPFEVAELEPNRHEFIVVLRKLPILPGLPNTAREDE